MFFFSFRLQLLFFAFVGLSTQAVLSPATNSDQVYGKYLDEPEAKNIQLSITKPQKFLWPQKLPNLPSWNWPNFQSLSWPNVPFLSNFLQKFKPNCAQQAQLTPAGSEAISLSESAFVAGVVQGDDPAELETVPQTAVEPVEPVKPEVVSDVSVESVAPAEVVESRSMRLPVSTRPPGVPHHDDTLGPVEVSPIFDPLVPVPYMTIPVLAPSSWLKFFI